jgi:hypothetical protein
MSHNFDVPQCRSLLAAFCAVFDSRRDHNRELRSQINSAESQIDSANSVADVGVIQRKATALRNRITAAESAVIELEAENRALRSHAGRHSPSVPRRAARSASPLTEADLETQSSAHRIECHTLKTANDAARDEIALLEQRVESIDARILLMSRRRGPISQPGPRRRSGANGPQSLLAHRGHEIRPPRWPRGDFQRPHGRGIRVSVSNPAGLRAAVESELEEDVGKAMKAATKDVVDLIREYREMPRLLRTEAPLVET